MTYLRNYVCFYYTRNYNYLYLAHFNLYTLIHNALKKEMQDDIIGMRS